MDSLKIRVDRIIDFGTIVGLVGTDLATDNGVVVHIDYRPLNAVYGSWRAAGYSEGIAFNADSLTVELGVSPNTAITDSTPLSA